MSLVVFPLGEGPLALGRILLLVDQLVEDLHSLLVWNYTLAVKLVLSVSEPDDVFQASLGDFVVLRLLGAVGLHALATSWEANALHALAIALSLLYFLLQLLLLDLLSVSYTVHYTQQLLQVVRLKLSRDQVAVEVRKVVNELLGHAHLLLLILLLFNIQ